MPQCSQVIVWTTTQLFFSRAVIILQCVTCFNFILQEKMKGKNKLVPRLLGVTKESILRVDEKTKEVCTQGRVVQT